MNPLCPGIDNLSTNPSICKSFIRILEIFWARNKNSPFLPPYQGGQGGITLRVAWTTPRHHLRSGYGVVRDRREKGKGWNALCLIPHTCFN